MCRRWWVWLGSDGCDIIGRVFECSGGGLNMSDGWQHSPVRASGQPKKNQAWVEEASIL